MKDLDKLIADRLIEAIGRDTVDRFEEDKDGNLKISLVSLECVAEKIADELLALIEQEKDDLLKEFVEWLKGVYAKDYDDKGKIADKSIGRGDKENFWYMEGQQTALQRIIDLLDNDLEKFLEENENESIYLRL